MSFTRWFVSATFTGGLIALSLQGGGVVQAAPIADSSSSSSQDGQQKVPSGMRDAESSSEMQRDKDGAGIADTQSHRIGGQFGTSAQRADTDTPKTPGSRLTEKSGITGSGSDKPGATVPTGAGSSSGMSGQSGAGTDPDLGAEHTSANPCESRGGQSVLAAEQDHGNDGHTIRGEVLRVEGTTYVVRDQGGKEVSLHANQTTAKPVTEGDFIQANVNEQNQVLWIGPLKSTDRRNEHETDCR